MSDSTTVAQLATSTTSTASQGKCLNSILHIQLNKIDIFYHLAIATVSNGATRTIIQLATSTNPTATKCKCLNKNVYIFIKVHFSDFHRVV